MLQVLIALLENKVDVTLQNVDVFKGEHLSKWYINTNSKGEVPVLKMADNNIADSDVIIDVIDSKFPACE